MGSADYTALTTAVVDGLNGVSTEMLGVIASITPIALVVVGAAMVVRFGVRVFKSVIGRV